MLRRLVCLLFIPLLPVLSQTLDERLHAAATEQQLTASAALRLEMRRVLAPGLLPDSLRTGSALPVKSATGLSFRVRSSASDPAIRGDELAKAFLSRPQLQTSMVSPGGFFRIHYDVSGPNAVDGTDSDGSGRPDYAEAVAAAFDSAYTVMIGEMGFDPPPEDNGVDGDEYDVYIENIPGAYGWTNFETQISADRWVTYIEVDNDYSSTPTRGLNGARVTAAHEFFHAVQLGYIGRDDDNNGSLDDVFLMEAGSTWMEDVVYDNVNDYLFYLGSFFNSDNRPFDYAYGIHMYGLCVWFHFLEKRTGGREIVRDIWDALVDEPAMQAMGTALWENGYDLAEELQLFRGWNCMTGYRSDPELYYPEGDTWPLVRLAGTFIVNRDTSFTTSVAYCTGRYYRFVNSGGDTAVVVPVHTGWPLKQASQQAVLTLAAEGGYGGFYKAGNGFSTRIDADNNSIWAGIAVSWPRGGQPQMITPFAAGEAVTANEAKLQVYPNPYAPRKADFVTLLLPGGVPADAELALYSVTGRRVLRQRLQENQLLFRWNGRDRRGRIVASGVYAAVVSSGKKVLMSAKMVLVK